MSNLIVETLNLKKTYKHSNGNITLFDRLNIKIKKVILCSGKIYFDLLEEREKLKKDNVIFYRIEQLYPFPAKTLAKVLKKYKNAEFIWCQEEPKNMGAWNTVRNYIDRTLEIIEFKNLKVKYIGRRVSCKVSRTRFWKRYF